MSDLVFGPDSIDFKSAAAMVATGRIRIDGDHVIVRTNAGEVTIPLASLLASNNNGEGASLLSVRNISNQFTPGGIESMLSEIKAEVDAIAGSGYQTIPEHFLWQNVGTGGLGKGTYNLSGVLPPEATHAVFKGRCVTNGSASVGISWYGFKVVGAQDNARWNNVFGNGGPAAADVTKTLILPLHSGRTTVWDTGVDSGGTSSLSVVGWLNIVGAGLTIPQASHSP